MSFEKWILPIEEITEFGDECYAHLSEEKERKETLSAHTRLCQKYWCKIVNKKNLDAVFYEFENLYFDKISEPAKEIFESMVANIVTIHDIGKVNPRFQEEKMENLWKPEFIPDEEIRNHIKSRHSILSSVFYIDYYYKKIKDVSDRIEKEESDLLKDFSYIFAYLISRHHGDLNDWQQFVDSMNNLESEGENLGHYAKQWLTYWNQEISGREDLDMRKRNWKKIMIRLKKEESKWQKMIYLYGFVRLLYSLLVAADYYATTEFMEGMDISDFGDIDQFENIISIYDDMEVQKKIRRYESEIYPMDCEKLESVDEINDLRNEMFLDSEKELLKNVDKNIFYLEAPTGSGKSNTAMNLSFQLLQSDENLNKIFYIYPFNTLVEQNMEIMEKTFGEDQNVMSQIAVVNSLVPYKDRDETKKEDDEEKNWSKILLDRQFLNYPIILSTHVTLFQTMFGSHKEDLFGFHQLCGSVIVLDEIQSYKNDLWNEMILFLKAFAKLFHIKFIIMSATLPNLEFFTGNKSDAVHLIKNREKYFSHKKFAGRVKFDFSLLGRKIGLDELKIHVLQHTKAGKKVLIEFIKKESAEKFFDSIKSESRVPVYLMTGDTSIGERKKLIRTIKKSDSLILVATQVIEAGVDIDMDIGYKDISKLDSEEQFVGRINRSCKNDGMVYFFDMDDASGIYKKDVRVDKNKTILREEIQNVLITKDFPQFYEKEILPELKKNGEKLDDDNLEDFWVKKVGALDMPEVAKQMRLIENDKQCKYIYFGRVITEEDGNKIDGKALWEEYKNLLEDVTLGYAERKVKLHNIRTEMNDFIFEFKETVDILPTEQIGDLYYIEEGEKYFDEDGKIKREEFITENKWFL